MPAVQMTLREWWRRLSDPRVIATWVAVSVVCVVAGPFGTGALPLVERFPYWFATNLLGAATSLAVIPLVVTARRLATWPFWGRAALGCLGFAIVFAGIKTSLETMLTGTADAGDAFAELALTSAVIAAAITAVVHVIERSQQRAAVPASVPRFLKRLRPELRTGLIRLAMQDHYVEAHASAGSQLVLMRFTDAMDELAGIKGWRVHRSHWVAEAGIASIRQQRGRAHVVTVDGAELPISRTYMPALRAAGLLQRFAA
ncbi:MAG: LytTR family DNA-binding domain-containing protein [Pseudomonadota bacterium]